MYVFTADQQTSRNVSSLKDVDHQGGIDDLDDLDHDLSVWRTDL